MISLDCISSDYDDDSDYSPFSINFFPADIRNITAQYLYFNIPEVVPEKLRPIVPNVAPPRKQELPAKSISFAEAAAQVSEVRSFVRFRSVRIRPPLSHTHSSQTAPTVRGSALSRSGVAAAELLSSLSSSGVAAPSFDAARMKKSYERAVPSASACSASAAAAAAGSAGTPCCLEVRERAHPSRTTCIVC